MTNILKWYKCYKCTHLSFHKLCVQRKPPEALIIFSFIYVYNSKVVYQNEISYSYLLLLYHIYLFKGPLTLDKFTVEHLWHWPISHNAHKTVSVTKVTKVTTSITMQKVGLTLGFLNLSTTK